MNKSGEKLTAGDFMSLEVDFGIVKEDICLIDNLKDFQDQLPAIKAKEYIAIDLEFVPAILIGGENPESLIQIAGFSPEDEEFDPKIWVIDILKKSDDETQEKERFEIVKIFIDQILGGVSNTKMGIGLDSDLKNLKKMISEGEEKKNVKIFLKKFFSRLEITFQLM